VHHRYNIYHDNIRKLRSAFQPFMRITIHRCDAAPFYIVDELDQALDSTYRAAVANMIKRQSSNEENPTQFICSTFRPELVTAANRCYGISHQNKVR
jgi:structural maintenance of chromosome 3 (chondroitin sulfate proteoglycan 6)